MTRRARRTPPRGAAPCAAAPAQCVQHGTYNIQRAAYKAELRHVQPCVLLARCKFLHA
jgi:hypothetical protein